MKKKEMTSLKAMSVEELKKVLVDAKTALSLLMINRHTKQMKNVHEGRMLRRKIAIVSTIIRQKELVHE